MTVVIGGQAGSCGKGKVCGFLAKHKDFAIATNSWATNAGHIFIDDDEKKIVVSHLPVGMVNPKSKLLLNAGAAITPEVLFDEIIKYADIIGKRKIYIHPNAVVITKRHREIEAKNITSGSTFKGCGAAAAEKMMRAKEVLLWKDFYANVPEEFRNRIEICDTAKILNKSDGEILIEGAQGQDLDINYGLDYPNVTSRMCSVSQLLAEAGLSPFKLKEVIMVIRPFPIRISNSSYNGEFYSGDYAGSREIEWEDVKKIAGAPKSVDIREYTTVTKKLRRVFEMNWERLKYNVMINRPTQIVLNFAEYLDWKVAGVDDETAITKKVWDFIKKVEQETGVPVIMVGTGARLSEMIVLKNKW